MQCDSKGVWESSLLGPHQCICIYAAYLGLIFIISAPLICVNVGVDADIEGRV